MEESMMKMKKKPDKIKPTAGWMSSFRSRDVYKISEKAATLLLIKIFEQFIICYGESPFANLELESCGRSPLQFLFCQVSWHESWHGHGQLGLDGKPAELSMIYFFPEATVLHTAELPGRHLCQCSYPTSWSSGISSENDGPILPMNAAVSKNNNSRSWKEQVKGSLPSSLVLWYF